MSEGQRALVRDLTSELVRFELAAETLATINAIGRQLAAMTAQDRERVEAGEMGVEWQSRSLTRDEAAEALEALVESRGPDWAANAWGIARDRLAGWLEGSEDLPDWMVTVMQGWTSAQHEKAGDVGCFEDADDHPPEVPEDVTETGLDAVPMPTSRALMLWESYRSGFRKLDDNELEEMEEAAWQEAGRDCGVDDALSEYEFLPEVMPITAWDKSVWWPSLIRKLADVVRSAIEEDDR